MIDKQLFIFSEIKSKELSVRQTEDLVRNMYTGGNTIKSAPKAALAPAFKKIEDNIASQFNTKVKLVHNKKGYGAVTFEYYSLDELNGLLEKLNVKVS
jgi:ParB family chromosome partitioning protein